MALIPRRALRPVVLPSTAGQMTAPDQCCTNAKRSCQSRAGQYETLLNLRPAKALGLTVSLPLLARADEVME
jgi:hypothetical protein